MKRFIAVAAALAACAVGASSAPALGVGTMRGSEAAGRLAQVDGRPAGLLAPWTREKIGPGDRDIDPWHIDHVRELQYRLHWVGLYRLDHPTGVYGGMTVAGVKAFQARRHLPVTGNAGPPTWKLLLQRTVRNPSGIPAVCKTAGWHYCYDRKFHSVTLWSSGTLYNTWLVRGGAYTMQTRVGTHKVYYRDIDHVSSQYGSPMPYAQFFDGGEAVHGSRLMTDPFVDHSHGCINMYVEDARQVWNLTHDKTLWVTVYGSWS